MNNNRMLQEKEIPGSVWIFWQLGRLLDKLGYAYDYIGIPIAAVLGIYYILFQIPFFGGFLLILAVAMGMYNGLRVPNHSPFLAPTRPLSTFTFFYLTTSWFFPSASREDVWVASAMWSLCLTAYEGYRSHRYRQASSHK